VINLANFLQISLPYNVIIIIILIVIIIIIIIIIFRLVNDRGISGVSRFSGGQETTKLETSGLLRTRGLG
jgi:hypothetical protein